MEILRLEQNHLQSISLNEMVEITGGESDAYNFGYKVGSFFKDVINLMADMTMPI